MKQILEEYSAYNLWANKKLLDTISKLGEEKIRQEIVNSFPSIYKTVVHMMEVENVWLQRLKLVENPTAPGWFNGDFDELSKHLLDLSQQWNNWVKNASETAINHVFAYYNMKKEYFKQPVYEVLLHLFNHQSYHRGQVVTMLRQLGVDKIPQTDFIIWVRQPRRT